MWKPFASTDPFQPKCTRTDRFVQMTQQEKIIEQKKREIQAKLEAKRNSKPLLLIKPTEQQPRPPRPSVEDEAASSSDTVNKFSNDGSFLAKFKQLKYEKAALKSKAAKAKSEAEKDNDKALSERDGKDTSNKITINTSFNHSSRRSTSTTEDAGHISTLSESFNSHYKSETNEHSSTASKEIKNVSDLSRGFASIAPSSVNTGTNTSHLKTLIPPLHSISSDSVVHGSHMNSTPPTYGDKVSSVGQDRRNLSPMKWDDKRQTSSSFEKSTGFGPTDVNLSHKSNLGDISGQFYNHMPPHSNNMKDSLRSTCIRPETYPMPLSSHMQVPPPPLPPPPPLMSQTFLSSASGLQLPNVNLNCPPPALPMPPGALNTSTANQSQPIKMPPLNVPPPPLNTIPNKRSCYNMNTVFTPGTAEFEAMSSLGRTVAQYGSNYEDMIRQQNSLDSNLWFLHCKDSMAYQQYRQLVDKYTADAHNASSGNCNNVPSADEIYDPDKPIEDDDICGGVEDPNAANQQHTAATSDSSQTSCKRKRKSRWGESSSANASSAATSTATAASNASLNQFAISRTPYINPATGTVMISSVARNDPQLIKYALSTYGSTNLSEEDWEKVEENFKMNLLYQEMLQKRAHLEQLQSDGKNKYEYDSDEDIDGGTWEHKLRDKEMTSTKIWATELTKQGMGKHHIGDFLPPEQLKKLLDKGNQQEQEDSSDYKEHEIKGDNIGFKMLQKLGWSEGQALGSKGVGITEPVNKASSRDLNEGLGMDRNDSNDDEYESYRKRMMLAYRFRPNPLNNPRRPYY